MTENSLLDDIKRKRSELQFQSTVVTSVDGCKHIERLTADGQIEIAKLYETSFGFVVDEKPDLQLAEILPFLHLSSQDAAHETSLLIKNKISHVLSIGVDILSSFHVSGIVYKKIDLLDLPEADLLSVLDSCFEFIDNAKLSGSSSKILVHCNAGYSRSPSIVAAYLMKTLGLSVDSAIQMIREKRSVRPNEGFMRQLKKFEMKLLKK